MLRKRTRSHQKDQHMNNLIPDSIPESYFFSDNLNQKHTDNSLLKVPGLFVGFNPKNSESDSVRSPTSPLDFRIFSSLCNPFWCPRSQNDKHQKSWDCSKVGLSIIDSLDDETDGMGKDTRSADTKNILFGRQMSVRSPTFCSNVSSVETLKSLPRNVPVFLNTHIKPANIRTNSSNVVFEIGETPFEPKMTESFRSRSVDSGRYVSHLTNYGNRKSRLGSGTENKTNPMPSESGFIEGSVKSDNNFGGNLSSIPSSIHSGNCFVGSIPESEIELSEDYTCVRTHGPNPRVTHIFGDCILKCPNDKLTNFVKKSEDDAAATETGGQCDDLHASYLSEEFLKFCYSCQKKLDGEDIYMYRGEKAFCSYSCRSQEIEIDEEMEKTNNDSSEISEKSNICKETSNSGLFITT